MYNPPVEYTGESVSTAGSKWSPRQFAESIVYGKSIPNNFLTVSRDLPTFREATIANILRTVRISESEMSGAKFDDVLATLAEVYRSTPNNNAATLRTVTEYAVPIAFASGNLVAMLAFLKRNSKTELGRLAHTTLQAYANQMPSDTYKSLLIDNGINNSWRTDLLAVFPEAESEIPAD